MGELFAVEEVCLILNSILSLQVQNVLKVLLLCWSLVLKIGFAVASNVELDWRSPKACIYGRVLSNSSSTSQRSHAR